MIKWVDIIIGFLSLLNTQRTMNTLFYADSRVEKDIEYIV